MTYQIDPVVIEISEPATFTNCAKVTVFDEGAAEVLISTVVNAESWPGLSDAILTALRMCNLEGDGAEPSGGEAIPID